MRNWVMIRVTDDPFAADLGRYKIIGAGGNFFTARSPPTISRPASSIWP
jgi:hypothetical protein